MGIACCLLSSVLRLLFSLLCPLSSVHCSLTSVFSSRRILSTPPIRVASANSPKAFWHPAPGAILFHGENHVLAASRLINACGRQDGAENPLVESNQQDHTEREEAADHAVASGLGFASRSILRMACLASLTKESRNGSRLYSSSGRGIRTIS